MTMALRRVTLALAFIGFSLVSSTANALLIAADYTGLFAGNQAYRDVGNAAKDTWEALATDWTRVADYNFTITMGTGDLGTDTFALTYDNHQTAALYPPTGTYLWTDAKIVVNSNAAVWNNLFWDPTPLDNSEYDMTQYGGLFGTGKAGTAADNKIDAYSTILHELGHALGFIGDTNSLSYPAGTFAWTAYTSFADNLSNSNKTFTYDWLSGLKGTTVQMQNAYHLDAAVFPYDTMRAYSGGGSGPQSDQRILISELDLNIINDAFHVPEPATLALLGIGLAGLGFSRRRKLH